MSYTHISEEAATYDLNQSSLGIVTAKFAIDIMNKSSIPLLPLSSKILHLVSAISKFDYD